MDQFDFNEPQLVANPLHKLEMKCKTSGSQELTVIKIYLLKN